MSIGPWLILILLFLKKTKKITAFTDEKPHDSMSVIVPFHGEWELIQPCLDSLIHQQYAGKLNIFIASHNKHKEDLENVLSWPISSLRTVRIIGCESDQKSKKLNLCLDLISDPYVAFLDADHIAETMWLDSAIQLLKNNPSWTGVQCLRKPIYKKGIIYAWDSLINHLGNEFLNYLKSSTHACIPFTGTTAVFHMSAFETITFGDSITEDTEWYFKKKSQSEKDHFFIGYGSVYGSREIMSHNLNNLIRRRIRWSSGHTKAYFEHFQPFRMGSLTDFISTLHGLHYAISVPITVFILANVLFLFFQMNLLPQLGILFCALGFSLVIRKYPATSITKPWSGLFFGFILIMVVTVFLTQFSLIGLDTIISKNRLVFLPGFQYFSAIGGYLILTFFCLACFFQRKMMNATFIFKAFVFSLFLIPIELFTSFVGFFESFHRHSKGWQTDRRSVASSYDRRITIILVLTLLASFWALLDGRSVKAFLTDVTAIHATKEHKKKDFVFSESHRLKGVAVNSPLSEMSLQYLSEMGVNSLRFYHDPGMKWVDLAHSYGITSTLQPSFSNWDHVDVRRPWAKWWLTWNLFYLDSKYANHPSVPFLLIGNEIEIWAFPKSATNAEKNDIREKFFSIFKTIEDQLKRAYHHFSIATPVVDSTTESKILMPNTLTTSFYYWDEYLPSLPAKEKSTIAGEWGGFQAPDETPPEWLRMFRAEIQWQYFHDLHFIGGYFFALQDNPSQPRMNSFNDPLNSNDPEDFRGIFDRAGMPKESYWSLAFLYTPIRVHKEGDQFSIENTSKESVFINNKELLPKMKMDGTSLIKMAKDNLYAYLKNEKRILFYHPQGRLSGCQQTVSGNSINDIDHIFTAKYSDAQKLTASHAILHSPGTKGLIEIHPSKKIWSVEGITKGSIKTLRPCRKPFFTEFH